jgi:hypothetical protein
VDQSALAQRLDLVLLPEAQDAEEGVEVGFGGVGFEESFVFKYEIE